MANMFDGATLFNNGDTQGGTSKPLGWTINSQINTSSNGGTTYYDIPFRSGSNLTRGNGLSVDGITLIGNDYPPE